jgi:hypothetical protein
MRHFFNGGSIEVPDAWHDRSVHSFVDADSDGSGKVSLVVHQVASRGTLEDFADQQLVEAAQKLRSYRLKWRRQVSKGLEISYDWSPSKGATVHQRQFFAARSPRSVIVVTLTTMASDEARTNALWNRFMTDLHIP